MTALPNHNASSILRLLFIMHLRTVPACVESMNHQTKQGRDEFLGRAALAVISNGSQCGEVLLWVMGATKLQSSPHTVSFTINTITVTNCWVPAVDMLTSLDHENWPGDRN